MNALAKIIITNAVEKLAEIHETTTENIYVALNTGNKIIKDQMETLIKTGITEVIKLKEELV